MKGTSSISGLSARQSVWLLRFNAALLPLAANWVSLRHARGWEQPVAYRTHASESGDLSRERNMDLLHEHDEMGPRAAPGGAHSAGPGVLAPRSSDESGIDKKTPSKHGELSRSNRRPGARAELDRRPNVPRLKPRQ
jgi:hypothetical protein